MGVPVAPFYDHASNMPSEKGRGNKERLDQLRALLQVWGRLSEYLALLTLLKYC